MYKKWVDWVMMHRKEESSRLHDVYYRCTSGTTTNAESMVHNTVYWIKRYKNNWLSVGFEEQELGKQMLSPACIEEQKLRKQMSKRVCDAQDTIRRRSNPWLTQEKANVAIHDASHDTKKQIPTIRTRGTFLAFTIVRMLYGIISDRHHHAMSL